MLTFHSQIYNQPSKSNVLPIAQAVPLKEEFKAENIIVFQSAKLDLTSNPAPDIDNTAVNIVGTADDVLLQVSIRRKENAIVLNSRPANGPWGKEERVPLKGLFVGLNTTITVYDHGDRYQVLIDYKTIHYFVKRFDKENGAAVLYSINPDQSTVFSGTLAATTYDSFANIIPNGA